MSADSIRKRDSEEELENNKNKFNPTEVFGQHEKRIEPLLQKGTYEASILGTFWGRRFALNDSSRDKLLSRGITNLSEYAKKKDLRNDLLGSTLEAPNERILSDNHELSNDTIRQDNYEFFLNNSQIIGNNLAKIILAKTERDRELKHSLEDLLDPNGDFSNTSPDVIIKELYNRLKKRNLYNVPEIQTALKILKKIDIVNAQEKDYQDTINEKRDEVISKLFTGYIGEIFPSRGIDDEPTDIEKMFLASMQKSFDIVVPTADENFGEYQKRVLEYINMHSNEETNKFIENIDVLGEKPIEELTDAEKAEVLKSCISHIEKARDESEGVLNYLAKTKASDLRTKTLRALGLFSLETQNSFFKNDKEAKEKAHSFAQNVALVSNIPPRAIVYSLYDDKAYYKAFKADISKEYLRTLKGVLDGNDDEALKVLEDARKILKDNKEVVDSIVTLDEQEKHNPLSFSLADKKNDAALKLLENAVALSIFKNKDSETFKRVYSDEAVSELLSAVIDPSIISKRPDVNEVNDIFNTYMLLQKSTTSQLDSQQVDKIVDSDVFQNSTVLDKEDLQNIKKFAKDLSKESEKVFANSTAGMPTQDELSFAIQEMAYLDIAKQQSDKLEFSPTNIGRFFRNNLAIYAFSNCMETAKNPSNNVETTPSMSKDCIKQLKEKLEREAEQSGEALAKAGIFAGFNPFTSLVIMQSIISKANADIIEIEMIKASKKISEQISYVERSANNLQKMARNLLVEADYKGASDTFVDKNVINSLANRVESEATAKSFADTKDVELIGKVKLKYSDRELDLNKIKQDINFAKDELSNLKEYKEFLYNKIIDEAYNGNSVKALEKEVKKVDRLSTSIQKRIVSDNETLAKIVENKLNDRGVEDKEFIESIKEGGLKNEDISKFFKNVADDDLKGEFLSFFEALKSAKNNIYSNEDNLVKSDRASLISNYLYSIRNSDEELFKLITKSNNQYVAIDVSGNKGYLQTGKGIDGYILQELQKEKDKLGSEDKDIDVERFNKLNSATNQNYNILSQQAKSYIQAKAKNIETANRERLNSVQKRQKESVSLGR